MLLQLDVIVALKVGSCWRPQAVHAAVMMSMVMFYGCFLRPCEFSKMDEAEANILTFEGLCGCSSCE